MDRYQKPQTKNNKIESDFGQDGSTSVLIVVLMIVLMSFGVAALTTAHAGYKISHRTGEFGRSSYELESQGQHMKYRLLEKLVTKRQQILEQRAKDTQAQQIQSYCQTIESELADLFEGQNQIENYQFKTELEDKVEPKAVFGKIKYDLIGSQRKNLHIEMELLIPEMTGQAELSSRDLVVETAWYQWQDLPNFELEHEFEETIPDLMEGFETEATDSNPFVLPEENQAERPRPTDNQ